jgi:hypothetical protein
MVNILLISNKSQPYHSALTTIFYDKHHEDPFCKSKEINDLFAKSLQRFGYIPIGKLSWLRKT